MLNYREKIGDRIKKLREDKGETQAGIAKSLNVKRETINQWEAGTRDLKTEYTIKLADYFDTTCDYILRGVEAERVNIHTVTGLSEKAILELSYLQNPKTDPDYAAAEKIRAEKLPEIEARKAMLENLLESRTIYYAKILKVINFLIENGECLFHYLSKSWYETYKNINQNDERILVEISEGRKGVQTVVNITPESFRDLFEYQATKALIELSQQARQESQEEGDD
jgi:transcriptional regulator with XRE-family HTH domain